MLIEDAIVFGDGDGPPSHLVSCRYKGRLLLHRKLECSAIR
jgi:hypothetical protein